MSKIVCYACGENYPQYVAKVGYADDGVGRTNHWLLCEKCVKQSDEESMKCGFIVLSYEKFIPLRFSINTNKPTKTNHLLKQANI